MFKSRKKILEEEAKKDPNYRPTKDLHEDNEEVNKKIEIPFTALIVLGVIILLIIACIIVIFSLGGPIKDVSSSI